MVTTTASAGSGFGIADALSDIIKKGIDKFLVGCADNMYEQGYRPTNETELNGTGVEIFVYSLTTRTADPWNKTGITNFIKKSLLLFIAYCFIYSMVGFVYVLLSMLAPAGADLVDSLLDRSSAFRNIRIKEYFGNLLVSITVLAFTHTVMLTAFALNLFMVSFMIMSCFETASISPSANNAILYLAISVFYAILTWFMLVREVLLYIFVASEFIIGGMLISSKTRSIGASIVYYFIGVLFLQAIIVGLTTIGFIAVDSIKADTGVVVGSAAELVLYFVLLGILVHVTLKLLFGLKHYKKKAMRLVI